MGTTSPRESDRTLLPAAITTAHQAELVDNILDVYSRASADQVARGMQWYPAAHDLAGLVGFEDYRKGAGIIAALSANTGWTQNVKLAMAIAAGQEVGHLSAVLAKVEAITAGADPEDVLGKGLKTRSFYRNILEPDVSGPVTIDRHAHDIARGQVWGSRSRGLTTVGRYEALAGAYRIAADVIGIRPHEMQAITWVVWRGEIKDLPHRTQVD
jgi:hypothetical protein